jgi:3-hydroxyisobutyrate dehydrogenase
MSKASHGIGWIGLGRMGEAMAARLLKAGHKLSVWNRTASKADPLAAIGAEVVTDKTAMPTAPPFSPWSRRPTT